MMSCQAGDGGKNLVRAKILECSRFQHVRNGPENALLQVQTYEEGVGCRVWILGKVMEPKKIQARDV